MKLIIATAAAALVSTASFAQTTSDTTMTDADETSIEQSTSDANNRSTAGMDAVQDDENADQMSVETSTSDANNPSTAGMDKMEGDENADLSSAEESSSDANNRATAGMDE